MQIIFTDGQSDVSFGILPSALALIHVFTSICVVDMSDPNESIPSVQPERIRPQILSVTCLIDKVVIRGSIGNSHMPLALMLNMMICNRN